ncbi:MAG: DedA family protein [Candidatus Aenigmarchaeota archaeon]|nr:DedA family protein [Candidatus Aenigmarchaeota archaeon]
MSFITGLVAWTEKTFLPFGPIGLFIVAFIESSFFPVPPDLILMPLCLISPNLALFYALVATIGSVSGSILGYYIGLKGGKPILNKIVSKRRAEKITNYYNKYGCLTIGIAGLTPIPYKLFTIASGVFKFSLPKLLLVSLFARGARFFLEAFVLMVYGEMILGFLNRYFNILTLVAGFVLVVSWFLYKRIRK